MKSEKTLVLMLILVLPIFIINSSEVNAISSSPVGVENKINIVPLGALAPDFNITDVDSSLTYELSDFQGKIVMLDLFATWCGPCIAALPIIRELYLMYPEDMFQIISIDVDTGESQSLVSNFRKNYGMDWIVGIDHNNTIDSILDYGSGYIPTMYLINETGHVIYAEIGFDESTVRSLLSSLLPDDTIKPSFEEVSFYNNTELSIFNPKVEVFCNISDDRNLETVQMWIENLDNKKISVQAKKINGFHIINQSISLDPLDMYPLTQLELKIYAKDYFGNYNSSSKIILSVTQFIDAGPPSFSNVAVEWLEDSATRYNVTVYASLEEDLLLMERYVWFMEGETLHRTAAFDDYNATHIVASSIVLYNQAKPWELTAHLVALDVAGNEVTEEYIVEETIPTETPTETPIETPTETDETGIVLIIPILSVFCAALAVFIRKRN